MKIELVLCKGVVINRKTGEIKYTDKKVLEVVHKVFKLRDQGLTYMEIANIVNKKSASSIRLILNNEYYLEYYKKGGNEIGVNKRI